jgi:hypothetical protein
LSWILLAVLVIIWAALLVPSRSPSPASSVEEFERKMNVLAETNRAAPGRWVLMPRRGQQFLGPRDRRRVRVRRRRRQVFLVLVDATALTLLMGLFPPLRPMLYGAAVLAVLLLAYAALLVNLRTAEAARTAARRGATVRLPPGVASRQAGVSGSPRAIRSTATTGVPGAGPRTGRTRVPGWDGYGPPAGNGWQRPRPGSGPRYPEAGRPAGEPGRLGGRGNGHRGGGPGARVSERELLEHGVQLIDDDVHVVVRRASDLRPGELASAAR